MNAPLAFATPPRRAAGMLLILRLAARDLRGGLRGFFVFIACIALGVMAIAGVRSVAASLVDGLARNGRVILGGDASFALALREASAPERAFLDRQGRVTRTATLRAMARNQNGSSALVEIKAVDAAYPLVGAVALDPPLRLGDALAPRDDIYGAAADPALLARLNLKPGDRITVGAAAIEIRASLLGEPDKLGAGIGFGPRLLIGDAALRATRLLQPGSLVRWQYRVRLPDDQASDDRVRALSAAAAVELPEAGWDIRTRTNASPALEQNVERFAQYLTLVGLTALLVGGVGVANAVKGHLDRKRDVIATLKSLGATGRSVFAIYLVQTLGLALMGALPGLAVGAALPFGLSYFLGRTLPLPLTPALYPGSLVAALACGLLAALTFALWPLGRARDVPVSALFRDEVAEVRDWPQPRYLVAIALVVSALGGLAVALAYDRKIAAIFVVAAAAVFVALRLIAALLMAAARRAPHAGSTRLRLALANIHRPGAITTSVVLSLGLGLALLVMVIEVDGNLHRQFLAALPDRAPSFFFLDIQAADAERFDALIAAQAPDARLERVPMLRGRIVAANGIPAEALKPAPNAAWVLESDRGITYADTVPAGSRLVAGEWWGPDDAGPPLVSMEKRIADGLGLRLGDQITVNILGRNLTARIANLRLVDWESLGINFVLVYSPATFRAAPHTDIATLTYRDGGSAGTAAKEIALLKAVADAFPAVTTVRVREALDAVGGIIANLVLGIRAASALTLLAAMLVLGGALAAGHRHRVYDAVVLKTLGATRGLLMSAYGLEYLLIGAASALFGIAAGSVAAYLVVRNVMNLQFAWLPGPALATAAAAIVVTVGLGLIGTYSALSQKPATVLRNL
jgi:putative ABC transport system permease protein